MRPQHLTMLVLLLEPLAFGSWLPRIPEIQQRLGLAIIIPGLALSAVLAGTLARRRAAAAAQSPALPIGNGK